jgi:hypothetical protein
MLYSPWSGSREKARDLGDAPKPTPIGISRPTKGDLWADMLCRTIGVIGHILARAGRRTLTLNLSKPDSEQGSKHWAKAVRAWAGAAVQRAPAAQRG